MIVTSPLTIPYLGDGVVGDVRAEVEGLLEVGRLEGVVNHHDDPGLSLGFGQNCTIQS